ncbi:hypothetical protein D3C74_23430 [compost metagenome]
MVLNTYPRRLFAVGIVGLFLLTACGKEDNTNTSNNNPETNKPVSQQPSHIHTQQDSPKDPEPEQLIDSSTKEFKEITEDEFKPEVSIDFEPYKNSFFDDEIITKLNETLEAVIAQDKEKFQAHLQKEYARDTLFFDDEKAQYMFYDLDILEKLTIDGRERINVGVRFAKKSMDNSIHNTGLTFFFTKNKEGQWGIANID